MGLEDGFTKGLLGGGENGLARGLIKGAFGGRGKGFVGCWEIGLEEGKALEEEDKGLDRAFTGEGEL
jgi:hypothetical protein